MKYPLFAVAILLLGCPTDKESGFSKESGRHTADSEVIEKFEAVAVGTCPDKHGVSSLEIQGDGPLLLAYEVSLGGSAYGPLTWISGNGFTYIYCNYPGSTIYIVRF